MTKSRHDDAVDAVRNAFVRFGSADVLLREFSVAPFDDRFSHRLRCEPDAFMQIEVQDRGGKAFFFVEIDRSTERLSILEEKVSRYSFYRYSGGLVGHDRSTKRESVPFRVLFVLKSAERRNNLIERLLARTPTVRTLVYASTLSEVLTDPFGRVWVRPSDYELAVRSTAFTVEKGKPRVVRGRQRSRDRIVDLLIQKVRLME